MSSVFRLEMVLLALLLISLIIVILKKKYLLIKYSTVWLLSSFLILVFAFFPSFMNYIANALGFEVLSNMIFLIIFGILFFITLSLTIIVSSQRKKIDLLIQEVSILKSKSNYK